MTTKKYLQLYDKCPRPFWKKREKWEGSYFGATIDWLKIRRFNKKLVNKYPWLIPSNRWSGIRITEAQDGGYWPGSPEDIPDYDYEYTELDAMPIGWRIAFGDQMVEELGEELRKANYADEYRILDIKEKYGGLRWYDNSNTKEGYNIINKYENLSRTTCICCGKPAKYITLGWISPLCEDCIKGVTDRYETVEEYFGEK